MEGTQPSTAGGDSGLCESGVSGSAAIISSWSRGGARRRARARVGALALLRIEEQVQSCVGFVGGREWSVDAGPAGPVERFHGGMHHVTSGLKIPAAPYRRRLSASRSKQAAQHDNQQLPKLVTTHNSTQLAC